MITLCNVNAARGVGITNISISNGKIVYLNGNPPGARQLVFNDAVAFPGLINSHDHLDFNLFPQLGDQVYTNYIDWGHHIHRYYKAEIDAVLNVPLSLRIAWGVYKNLLCGVTTVVNHGARLEVTDPLINILQTDQSIHSVGFDKYWKLRLNDPRKMSRAAIVHTGEGMDDSARAEISRLSRWNLLRRKLVAVHGVAMTAQQAGKFRALVWCPESNLFLLNSTAPIKQLKTHLPVVFGTDSTLTGNWDIWHHIRTAQQTGLLTDDELWNSLNTAPATLWKRHAGIIAPGYDADLVVAKTQGGCSAANLLSIEPKDILLVLHGGQVRLFDESLYHQLKDRLNGTFSMIKLNNSRKYVAGDIPALIGKIKGHYPGAQLPVSAA